MAITKEQYEEIYNINWPPNSVDLAWFAGLFEGEGCISFENSGKHHSVRLVVVMTDQDVLEKIEKTLGVGKVSKSQNKTQLTPTGKIATPTFRWRVGNKCDVERILIAIRPFMGKRRTIRIDEALERLKGGDRGYVRRKQPRILEESNNSSGESSGFPWIRRRSHDAIR